MMASWMELHPPNEIANERVNAVSIFTLLLSFGELRSLVLFTNQSQKLLLHGFYWVYYELKDQCYLLEVVLKKKSFFLAPLASLISHLCNREDVPTLILSSTC